MDCDHPFHLVSTNTWTDNGTRRNASANMLRLLCVAVVNQMTAPPTSASAGMNRMARVPMSLNLPPLVLGPPLSPTSHIPPTPTPILSSPIFPPFLASYYSPPQTTISESPESRSPTICVLSPYANQNDSQHIVDRQQQQPLTLGNNSVEEVVDTIEDALKGGPNKAPGWERSNGSSQELRYAAMRGKCAFSCSRTSSVDGLVC